MSELPFGAVRPTREVTGLFPALVRAVEGPAVFIVDQRVLALHPDARRALAGHQVISLRANEQVKSLATVEALARKTLTLPRAGTVVVVGGGTIGDVVTVFAHLHKRGVRLVQVPTTLLAAVDSSLGGKGAVNVVGVKNALGVFHGAAETWLCSRFFGTLDEAQRREGRLEAWKMVVTLDAATFRRWARTPPNDAVLLREARALKAAVVRTDPYETRGVRLVLNFGHTFGHLVESLSGYRVRHGDAVGLGMLCALDVGVAMGLTPATVRATVEGALPNRRDARAVLRRLVKKSPVRAAATLLAADKKGDGGALRMVLLDDVGRWGVHEVPRAIWQGLWSRRWAGR